MKQEQPSASNPNTRYERHSPTLWALNAGYNVLGFVAMGAVIGWVQ